MVKRKVASGLNWVGQKALSVIVLAALLMIFAIPVVVLTNAGFSETWAYLALAGLLIGLTGGIVGIIMWGIRRTGIYSKEGT